MNLELDHKLALVTASTGGIGKEIATILAREGARVIVNGRTAASVDAAIADARAHVPAARLERLVMDAMKPYRSEGHAYADSMLASRPDS